MADPVKAIIWATPRTCSTALLKCLSALPNTKVFDELYSVAFLFGPERLDPAPPDEPPLGQDDQDPDQSEADRGYAFPSSICTYDWIKRTLDKDYPGKQVILSKEIVYCLNHRYASLPKGYRHIFLLRHPQAVFPSWKKLTHEALMYNFLSNNVPKSLDDFVFDTHSQAPHILPPGMSFKEGYDLYEYIKAEKLDADPVVIDADDLVENPAAIISALCGKLGVPYSDSLLTWDKGMDIVNTWTIGNTFKFYIQHTEFYKNFRDGTGFQRQLLNKQATISPGDTKVTPDIKRCVDFSMPFFSKMYEQRLKGDSAP